MKGGGEKGREIDRRREKWGHACNPRGNRSKIVGIRRNISANYSPPRNERSGVVLEQSRQYAYNLKCFKMEIKRRLRAFCKATRRALEYIIEQCQHLSLITFRPMDPPTKISRANFIVYPLLEYRIFFHPLKNFNISLPFFYGFSIHRRKRYVESRVVTRTSKLHAAIMV